jgi:hypothetical protein
MPSRQCFAALRSPCCLEDELMVVRLGLKNPDGKYLFNPDQPGEDPIILVVTIENVSDEPLLASRGYADNLELMLRFADPDGFQVTAQNLLPGTSGRTLPTFPDEENEVNVPGEPVEKVAQAGVEPQPGEKPYPFTVEFDIRGLYLFPRPGIYTGKEFVPVGLYYDELYVLVPGFTDIARFDERIFGEDLVSNGVTITLIDDADLDLSCAPVQHPGLCPSQSLPDCEDRPAGADGELGTDDDGANIGPGKLEIANNGLDDDCNPATPDIVGVVTGTIENKAVMYTVDEASPLAASPTFIEGLPIRVYDMAEECVHNIGDNWQNYKSIWNKCAPKPYGVGRTNAAGTAEIKIEAGNYLVIARYEPDAGQDPIYIGVSADDVGANQKITRYLPLIATDEGVMPGKCHVVKGSELLIFQTQYAVWRETEQKCPFVFESNDGNWSVATKLDPPKGFSASDIDPVPVNSETVAVQSVITKEKTNAKLGPVKVTYNVKLEGWKKAKRVESKIDLVPGLAGQ